jgi:hypothetical protein
MLYCRDIFRIDFFTVKSVFLYWLVDSFYATQRYIAYRFLNQFNLLVIGCIALVTEMVVPV